MQNEPAARKGVNNPRHSPRKTYTYFACAIGHLRATESRPCACAVAHLYMGCLRWDAFGCCKAEAGVGP